MSGHQPTISETANAKLNLYLHVTGRRSDGYHELDTLFAFVEFGDVLTIEPSDQFQLDQRGNCGDQLPDPSDNLAWKAAHLLANAFGREPSVAINLDKRLPVASGLGGGSADAAAVLRSLCRLWDIPLTEPAVQQIATKLGADVPACLGNSAAFATGIGDVLQPTALPQCGVLLANSNLALQTKNVFGALRDRDIAFSKQNQPVGLEDFGALIGALSERSNDLQHPAIRLQPAIADVLEAVGSLQECALARMSGSGASCFGLFQSFEAAKSAASALQREQPDWWIQPTQLSEATN